MYLSFSPIYLTLTDGTPVKRETFIRVIEKFEDLNLKFKNLATISHGQKETSSLSKRKIKELIHIGFADPNGKIYDVIIRIVRCLTTINDGNITFKYPFI